MTTLPATKQEPINQLTPVQRGFVTLRSGHQSVNALRKNSVNSIKRALADILTKAFFDAGDKAGADETILQFQTEGLYNELKGKLGDLTLKEVEEAFNRGIRGETGPYFGMCPKTYHQFLKYYYELPERQQAWLDYLALTDEVKTSKEPVYFTKENLKSLSVQAFNEFKESGRLPIPSAAFVFYDTIKEALKVDSLIRKEDWKDVYNEAKTEYTAAQKALKREKERKDLKLDFTLATAEKPGNKAFEGYIKKVGLKYYFSTLISKGGEMKL